MTVTRSWTSAAAGGTLDLANGQVVTEAVWDAMISNLNHLGTTAGYVGAIAGRNTNQSIGNNALTAVSFPTEEADTDGMFTAAGTLITVQNSGLYLAAGYCAWDTNGTGRRTATIAFSGAIQATDRRLGLAADIQENFVFFFQPMTAGNTVGLTVLQDSGGSLNINRARLLLIKL